MKKIVVLGLVFFTFLLAPLQSVSMTTTNEKAINDDKENNISLAFIDLEKILWKIDKKEVSKLNSLLGGENQKTKDIFNSIISDTNEDDYPKIIDFPKTDEIISESSQEEDDFFESETWGWYKQRLGWILEAAEVINELTNNSVDIIGKFLKLPIENKHLLNFTINCLNNATGLWKAGILDLRRLSIDKLTYNFNMIKQEISNFISLLASGFENLTGRLQENITGLTEWWASKPYDKNLNITCNIEKTKNVGIIIHWGRLFGPEMGNHTISLSSASNEDNKQYTIDFDTDGVAAQYFAHFCWVRIEKTNGDNQTRYCWAFSDAHVHLDFFSDEEGSSRQKIPVFYSLSEICPLFFRFLRNLKFLIDARASI